MNFREAFSQSVDSLNRNRVRSGLTMLGIMWGLVTVVLLLSYGKSLGNTVLQGFLGIGNNIVMIWGGQTSMQSGGERSGQKIILRDGDMEAIRDSLPYLKAISRETDDAFSIKYGPKVVTIQSKAVDLSYGGMRKLDVETGRYFEADDFSAHRQVCIFGSHAAEKLFNGYPPVGEVVQIEGQPFTVIGVLRNKIQDSSNNGPDNENVFVPFPTMRTLRQQRDPNSLVFQPSSPDMHLQALQAVRTVLGQRHHFDPKDPKAINSWDTIEDSKGIMQFGIALQVLLGIIGAMTLAVGARRRDIRRQFLLEALTLTFLAGAIGMIAAIVVAHLVPAMPLYSEMYKTANHEGDIILSASGSVMLTSFIILALVGIVSGMLPAMRAAKMDPVVALRHE